MEIKLTNGKKTKISIEDEWLTKWRWYQSNKGYVYRKSYIGKVNGKYKYKSVFLHKEVAGVLTQVDHINGDKLDNQRSNLRSCSPSQNAANRRRLPTNKSGYKGVSWYKPSQKWRASICQGKTYNLGHFQDKEEAALAYNRAAIERFGEFAVLNEVSV